jgi:hypothetical protein
VRPQFGSRWAAAIAEGDETYIGKMGTRERNRRVPPASKGCYSIFKRGMKGVRQHCKEKHLHRYLTKFDFRYSNRVQRGVNDVARADRLLKVSSAKG